jgi:hypothetical protein
MSAGRTTETTIRRGESARSSIAAATEDAAATGTQGADFPARRFHSTQYYVQEGYAREHGRSSNSDGPKPEASLLKDLRQEKQPHANAALMGRWSHKIAVEQIFMKRGS